jgi:hypothetical protein
MRETSLESKLQAHASAVDNPGTTFRVTRVSSGTASVNVMVNAELRTLHAADGTPVCNVSFDLSNEQLRAAAHAAEAIRLDRHRHLELSTDDVLALRELTGITDELQMLADQGANATVILQLARFVALHDALVEWVHAAQERGWMREDDAAILPFVAALLDPMASLRADALHAVLGETARTADAADA